MPTHPPFSHIHSIGRGHVYEVHNGEIPTPEGFITHNQSQVRFRVDTEPGRCVRIVIFRQKIGEGSTWYPIVLARFPEGTDRFQASVRFVATLGIPTEGEEQ